MNLVLCVFLVVVLSLSIETSAKNIIATDSEGRKHNGTGVLSPGQSIEFKCGHSGEMKWSRLRGSATEVLKSNNDITISGNTLKIKKVDFQDSGLYYCEQSVAAYRFFLTVLEITKITNGTVPMSSILNEVNGVSFNQSKISEKSSVNMSCSCNAGVNNTQIVVNWKGGIYAKLSDLYTIESTKTLLGVNSTLTLKKATNNKTLYGEYTCSCNVVSGTSIEKSVYLEVPPIFENHISSLRTTEGENVTIYCNVWGYPEISNSMIYWSFQNQNEFREGISKIFNSTNPGSSQLFIPKVTNADRGVYTCHASNRLGANSASTMLRVKGRYAALWPFIGILIQLVILVAIIVIYEYKKSQKSKEEPTATFDSKTEPDTMGGDRTNESVRQRLVKV